MKVTIGDKEINLVPKEVALANKLSADFLASVQKHGNENDLPTLYYTTLIVMHKRTADLIETLSPEVLAKILNAREQSYNNRKKGKE